MEVKRSVAAIVSVALALSGCATASKDIATSYVSPNQYASYDCGQLAAEAGRIQTRVVALGGRLDQAAQNDAGIMVVGVVLFWPVLVALRGTKQQEAEYGRLKGEYEAVAQASIAKKCAHAVPQSQTAAVTQPGGAGPTAPAPVLQPAVFTSTTAQPTVAAQATNAVTSLPAGGTSKFMISAERFAKDSGYGSAAATMSVRTATYESFTVTCANSDPRLIRCDDGQCRELR